MTSHIQRLEAVPAAVLSRDFNFLLDVFALPLGLYFQNALLPCNTANDLITVAQQLGDAFRRGGLYAVSVKTLSSTEDGDGGYNSVLLDQTYCDAKGDKVDQGLARYFYRVHHGRPRVELFECLKMPVADVVAQAPMFRAA